MSQDESTAMENALPESAQRVADLLRTLGHRPPVVRLPASVLVDGSKVFVLQGNVATSRPVTVADREGGDALDAARKLRKGLDAVVERVPHEVEERLADLELAQAYRPVAEAVRRLRFHEALAKLSTFRHQAP